MKSIQVLNDVIGLPKSLELYISYLLRHFELEISVTFSQRELNG